jgi:alcohol dehydrogenase
MNINAVSTYFCPTKVYVGVGAHRKLEDVLKQLKCERVFIMVDAALLSSPLYQEVQSCLQKLAVSTSVFSDIEPDPSARTVEKAFAACREHQAQAILAVGGGSTMDAAKAVGILATNGGRIHDYEGIEKFSVAPLPRIAIPTTAGTGSEVSGSCVITDTDRQLKMSIRHAALNPADIAILDPLAVSTVPAHVAAHSGIDAFVHAFESYISLGANPFTDALNLHAIRLLAGNIRQFVANRGNTDAALAMLSGSALAGMAFGITGLGNVHCMARFVGAKYHVSHGLSNALCLPVVAQFNLSANPRKYAQVAAAMGRHVEGLSELDAAAEAVTAIRSLCQDLSIPSGLSSVGAQAQDIEEMARMCVDANYNRCNPRHTTYGDFVGLFEKAL